MIQNHNRVALLLSGGPDSTTLLYDLLNQGKEIYAVTFNFGETEGCNESQHAQRIVTNLHSERLHHYQYDFPSNLSVSMNCLSLSSSAKHLGHLSLPLIRKSMFSLLDRQLRLC